MKTKVILGFFLLSSSVLLASGQAKPARAKKADPDMVQGRLLRMDLLERKDEPSTAAKRDPFVPGARFDLPAGTPMQQGIGGFRQGMPGFNREAEPAAETPPEPPVNVRYVGFIRGREKFLALVLFNGQAMAVGGGESLGDVWKVVRVTPEEIEIQGPDGAGLKFALEGERK
jgi:hypothetical protein